ncbi:uncharacterized protein MYCFIDRAFT_82953 [Pseudocercospora fijiensis CIRAD86]|uniref:Uncharacterized protein n=1 Tax=Pseudocercospora fijiensis (strain CIRAD86) TaxID=383855 RepID=M3AJY3_PSEFD|nr:uncharacterized protein MYCFIDRAFT_82953 [Pseudocercospora fijiensis CIRAD86]EME84886.1 hypothetical protein MYCFIDRAFT_82953 [Pseudocercospora fijiensis CIRAD86]
MLGSMRRVRTQDTRATRNHSKHLEVLERLEPLLVELSPPRLRADIVYGDPRSQECLEWDRRGFQVLISSMCESGMIDRLSGFDDGIDQIYQARDVSARIWQTWLLCMLDVPMLPAKDVQEANISLCIRRIRKSSLCSGTAL